MALECELKNLRAERDYERNEFQKRIEDLEKVLKLKEAVDAPPARKKKVLAPVKAEPPQPVRRVAEDASSKVPAPVLEAKPESDQDDQQVCEGEEEEEHVSDQEVEPETTTTKPSTTNFEGDGKNSEENKVNSSTHRAEYMVLARRMQRASSTTELPQMAKLWSGSSKDRIFALKYTISYVTTKYVLYVYIGDSIL